MAKKEEPQGKEGEKVKDPELIKKLMFFGLLGLNLLSIAGGTTLTYLATLGNNPEIIDDEYLKPELERARKKREERPIVYSLEPFTVNLMDEPRKIIRVVVSLGMLDEAGYEEVVTMAPQARDAVVKVFQDKYFENMESIQGKLFLKDQIAQAINGFLDQGVVKEVYFSDFIAQ